MTVEGVLRAVLGLLALYHVGIGLASTFAPRTAGRLARVLYALEAEDRPQVRYGLRMLGLYALAFGALAGIAALEPRRNVPIILVLAGLQLARALARLLLHAELAAAFRIPARRNRINAGILAAEAALLAGAVASLG